MFLHYKNKARGDTFKKKGAKSKKIKVKVNNPRMIQLNGIQVPNQTPSHNEFTKLLNISQPEIRIIGYYKKA